MRRIAVDGTRRFEEPPLAPLDLLLLEVKDVGAHPIEEGARVRHHHRRLVPPLQVFFQPEHRVQVSGSSARRAARRRARRRGRGNETRIRHPPLNDAVGRACAASSNPSPERMAPARAGAVSASIPLQSIMHFQQPLLPLGLVAQILLVLHRRYRRASGALARALGLDLSRLRFQLRLLGEQCVPLNVGGEDGLGTESSPPATSCSMCSTCNCGGIPSKRCAARNLSRVVLPMPLRPTSPYLRPLTSVRLQSSRSAARCPSARRAGGCRRCRRRRRLHGGRRARA